MLSTYKSRRKKNFPLMAPQHVRDVSVSALLISSYTRQSKSPVNFVEEVKKKGKLVVMNFTIFLYKICHAYKFYDLTI